MKAFLTSSTGHYLKLNSTKKITKKLAGAAAETSSWCTNVGNEYGEILMSVLTTAEGDGLYKMGQGLVNRYRLANAEQPTCIYVDRGCCATSGQPSILKIFEPWDCPIRLDIFHFLRRLSLAADSESHPAFGTFMSHLSNAIFEWNDDDLGLLKATKKKELESDGRQVTARQVEQSVTRKELQQHCRRKTRGVEETIAKIEAVFSALKEVQDNLGKCFLNPQKLEEVWDQQKRHVACIQDLPGSSLYTQMSSVKEAGHVLPVYRCGRGSSSLESFHLHLARFIPGTSANMSNMQVYLLEGIARWNTNRQAAASLLTPDCYDIKLLSAVNQIGDKVLGRPICAWCPQLSKYTGELIGLEYLLDQSNTFLRYDDVTEETEQDADDEGYAEDVEGDDMTVFQLPQPCVPISVPSPTVKQTDVVWSDMEWSPEKPASTSAVVVGSLPASTTASATCSTTSGATISHAAAATTSTGPSRTPAATVTSCEQNITDASIRDEHGIPGWEVVDKLTDMLLEETAGVGFTDRQANNILDCIQILHPVDRKKTNFQPRVGSSPAMGNLKLSRMSSVIPGVDSTKRVFIGSGIPAQKLDCNRIVEMLCSKLMKEYPTPKKKSAGAPYQNRYQQVLRRYITIKENVLNCKQLMKSGLTIPHLNQTTLSQWYNNKIKKAGTASNDAECAPVINAADL